MKAKSLIAAAIAATVFFSSCKKENLTPATTAIHTSNIDDFYTETDLTIQKPVTYQVDPNIGGYLEALPAHYADHPGKHYPLILFLNGFGELGNGSQTSLPILTDNGIPKMIAEQTFPSNFFVNDKTYQFIVLSPQFAVWPVPADITFMIDYACKTYRVDSARIYICAISMGGGDLWDYASSTTNPPVAAIVPVAGASYPTEQKGEAIAKTNIAVWSFHNADDPTVPSWYSISYTQYINEYNPEVQAKLTVWPTGGHDAWTKATDPNYREDGQNIYEWMLSHHKRDDGYLYNRGVKY
jgi:predicted peptidase